MSALVLREAPFDGVPWAFLMFGIPRLLCSPSSCLWPWNQSQSATLKDDSAPLPHQQERGMRREEASYDHGCTGVFTIEGQNQSSAMLHKRWSYGSSMIGCAAISVTPLTRQNMMITLPPFLSPYVSSSSPSLRKEKHGVRRCLCRMWTKT